MGRRQGKKGPLPKTNLYWCSKRRIHEVKQVDDSSQQKEEEKPQSESNTNLVRKILNLSRKQATIPKLCSL